MRKLDEKHIARELVKTYDPEAAEIILQFLTYKGKGTLADLGSETMRLPEPARKNHLAKLFSGLTNYNDSLRLSGELLAIFEPDPPVRGLKTSWPDKPNNVVHYVYTFYPQSKPFGSYGPWSNSGDSNWKASYQEPSSLSLRSYPGR